MAQVSYPGVYIEEIPSDVRTITSVSTSIAAFVDYFREGEINKPIDVFGMGEFQRVFGGLDPRSASSYAIDQFFRNGGTHAVVVRSVTQGAGGAARASVDIRPRPGAAAPVIRFLARSPGAWGNQVRVEIDHLTEDPDNLFNVTAVRYSADGAVVAHERFPSVSLVAANTRYVVDVLERDSTLVRATLPAPAIGVPAANGTESWRDLLTVDFDTFAAARTMLVQVGPGAAAGFRVTLQWPVATVITPAQAAARLQVAIRTAVDTTAAGRSLPPELSGATVTVKGENAFVVMAGRGGPTADPLATLVFADDGAAAPGDAATALGLADLLLDMAVVNVQQYPLGSAAAAVAAYVPVAAGVGTDGNVPGVAELVGPGADAANTGLYALRKADLFNILCLPRAVSSDFTDIQMTQVVETALAFCQSRRAFMLVDLPQEIDSVAEARDWLDVHASAFRHRNAAVYFPRVKIPDPLTDYRLRSFPASGTIAGLFARTDGNRGVWKAPAGLEATLYNVRELDYKLSDAENGILNPLAINCIRELRTSGTVCWGARTSEGEDDRGSEWKYIPVRRLALMIEETLFRQTRWVVFEPNDEILWAKIRLNIGAYMMSLFRQGAFQNVTMNPRDSFRVKCDGETTTADDRAKGIVNIEVWFAPLRPAEFVVIKIRQIPDTV